MMKPTAVIALVFANGSVGRMQFFAKDTSDERIQSEIDRSVFSDGAPVSWSRRTMADFPDADLKNAWVMSGGKIVHDQSKVTDIQAEQQALAQIAEETAQALETRKLEIMTTMSSTEAA